MKTGIPLSLALVALTALSGCGLRTSLDRPPPMWGAERARWEAEQQRAAEERARAEAAGETAEQPAPAPNAPPPLVPPEVRKNPISP